MRALLPIILVAVAVYTFKKKDLGSVHAPMHSGLAERYWAIGIGAAIGFYDGFFGPGTGSFLIFLFVRFFGFDFLSASAAAKIVNVACNFSALMWFGYSGHILWQLGLLMAGCQIAGSLSGTRLATQVWQRLCAQGIPVCRQRADCEDRLRCVHKAGLVAPIVPRETTQAG